MGSAFEGKINMARIRDASGFVRGVTHTHCLAFFGKRPKLITTIASDDDDDRD